MLPTEIKVGHVFRYSYLWHLTSPTTPSRSAGFGTAPISAGIPARTTSPRRRSSNGNPETEPQTAAGEEPGAHLRNAEKSGKFLDFQHFSC